MSDAERRRAQILESIGRAAALARRDAREVTLVAVTKTRSMAEIAPLIAAGQRDFGESRVSEALEKWPPAMASDPGLRLHCIGRLQSNKARDAVRLFDVIHSVDRMSLVAALSEEAARADRAPKVYLQVNIGEEAQKGGCAIADVPALLAAIRGSPLSLAGLMAIPPVDVEPSPFFALLAELALRHDVSGLSMGMSGDYAAAVMLGATTVRVGSALFEG